jgi:hypothetical protein
MKKKVNDFFTKNLTTIITIFLSFSGIASGYKILEYRVSELEKNKDSKIDYVQIEQMVNKVSKTDLQYQKENLADVKRAFEFFRNKQIEINSKTNSDVLVIRQALRDRKILTQDYSTSKK